MQLKQTKAIIKFFMTKNNMNYLLKGNSISNFDKVRDNLLSNISKDRSIKFIYEPRKSDPNHPNNNDLYENLYTHESEYPDSGDRIVAKILRYIHDENNEDSLEIEIIDSLYYAKLSQPVIKINGYCSIDNGNIVITNITRLTLADRNC